MLQNCFPSNDKEMIALGRDFAGLEWKWITLLDEKSIEILCSNGGIKMSLGYADLVTCQTRSLSFTVIVK